MPSVICSTDTGKRSTSQPRRSSPALASTEPKMPALTAEAISWAKSCPANVAWLTSMLTLISCGQVVPLQERVNGGDVVVVLVLRRLERLRFEEDRAVESDALLVLDDERQEAGQLIELTPHVGVEQCLVAFASAPQHVVVATQPMCGFEAVGHLAGGEGEDLRIRVGGRARLIARIGEQVGGAPQQLRRRCAPDAAAATSTISSRRAADSANVDPSGAMSRSWKQ